MIDVCEFKPLALLQRNWTIIAAECAKLPMDDGFEISDGVTREDIANYLIENNTPGWIDAWDFIEGWRNWGIAINYQYPLGDAGLQKTTALLKQVKGLKFASLSLFKAGTLIPMHTHSENAGLLTFHLGLSVPNGCYVYAHGEMIKQENGKAIIFDGTFPHYSFNASNKGRLILYCEFSPERLSLTN